MRRDVVARLNPTIISDEAKPISTKEARKILGKDFVSLTDTQIDDLVTKLYLIAKGIITIPDSSI